MRIGVVINPFAGLGGSVGLKGTDGPDTVAEALRRGAVAKSGERARAALSHLAARVPGASIVVASGALGQDWVAGLDLDVTVVGGDLRSQTARDTTEAVAAMLPLDVIVFAGGDGTARDVAAAAGQAAILGIPCGVKMHSGVFAVTPRSAGALMADLLSDPGRVSWIEDAEIADIDEGALRQGILAPRLYRLARAPVSHRLMQAAKGGPRNDARGALLSAARDLVDSMEDGVLYVIGPGTSTMAVASVTGQTATPLGVDAMIDRRIVAQDVGEDELLDLADARPVRIILGVTGQQGFLLGRGNQQIGPRLIRRAGREGIHILATEDKLVSLAQPRLLVDTGDAELDEMLQGFVRVSTGSNRQMMMRIASC